MRAVAFGLKCAGHAKRYADGYEIFPKIPKISNAGDIDEYSMPGNDQDSSSGKYAISLNSDSVERLISLVAERIYPRYNETLRLLAKCSAGCRENRELLMESDKLREAVHRELSTGSQASTCYNALKLIEQGATVPKNAFPAVARSLLLFSGHKPSGYKGMRSHAIENAALGAMNMLTRTMGEEEWEQAMRTIEKELSGKLGEELFRKVHAICLRKAAPAKE